MSNLSVVRQLADLYCMPFSDLKQKYCELFGKESPNCNRKQVLSRLAYRIQEIACGGLSEKARTRLEAIHKTHGQPKTQTKSIKKEMKSAPTAGTKLFREYLGRVYEVIVCEKGYEYEGKIYRSLSAIAREITGSTTSGPLFFGLTKNRRDK